MGLVVVNRRVLLIAAVLSCLSLTTERCAAAVTVATTGVELLPSGDMEEPGAWEGVSSGSSTLPTVVKRTASKRHGGHYGLKVVIKQNQGQEWPAVRSAPIRTETGKTYRIRFWAKVSQGAVAVRMRNGTSADYTPILGGYVDEREWREYVTTYRENAGGGSAYLAFFCGGDEVTFYLDDVSVEQVINSSAEETIKQWRQQFPESPYLCWQKYSPWENLDRLQAPAKKVEACENIRLDLGRNEYESTSFVLTNLSDAPVEFKITYKPMEISTTLRKAVWITSHSRHEVNDALSLIDEGLISIPSGESREIWMTFHTNHVAAGEYKQKIEVFSQGLDPWAVDIDITVHDIVLPEKMPVHLYYWDYVIGARDETPEYLAESMADLKSHYANVAMLHPSCCPRFMVDAHGQLKTDYAALDQALDAYEALAPETYFFNWNIEGYLEPQEAGRPAFMTAQWKTLFAEWLTDWVAHLKSRGIGYDRLIMCPYDERLDMPVRDMAQLVKEIDPQLRVYVNAMGSYTSEEVEQIAPYVDVWCPHLCDYLDTPPYDRNWDVKKTAKRLLKKENKLFWTYTMPLDAIPLKASSYADYRLSLWQSWKAGMTGFGYWIYNYNTRWDSSESGERQYAVVYRTDAADCPAEVSRRELVVPGKRWEATREGVEDYAYLTLLKQALSDSSLKAGSQIHKSGEDILDGLTEKVLSQENNSLLADKAKTQIIEAILQLSTKQKR